MLPARRESHDIALDAALAKLGTDRIEDVDRPDGYVTAVRRLPPLTARYTPIPETIDARLQQALAMRGIERLYSHQGEAIEHAVAGRNVVVITPTASGKTLCYNAPVLNAILQDASSRALYLFPTKALAQDQLAELHAMCETLATEQIGVFTYDGDTPQDARRTIRARAHVCSAIPTWCTRASCRTIRAGRSCSRTCAT
jgi:DEAD/DEAH box helicase domain-containing protein